MICKLNSPIVTCTVKQT
uniref:Uncharacterized protein n=1 Tax=Anguilla anguilla TaxID=7936 RepID=A0A0E9V3C8_ANGAN